MVQTDSDVRTTAVGLNSRTRPDTQADLRCPFSVARAITAKVLHITPLLAWHCHAPQDDSSTVYSQDWYKVVGELIALMLRHYRGRWR